VGQWLQTKWRGTEIAQTMRWPLTLSVFRGNDYCVRQVRS